MNSIFIEIIKIKEDNQIFKEIILTNKTQAITIFLMEINKTIINSLYKINKILQIFLQEVKIPEIKICINPLILAITIKLALIFLITKVIICLIINKTIIFSIINNLNNNKLISLEIRANKCKEIIK
jgi:hypothetical protein